MVKTRRPARIQPVGLEVFDRSHHWVNNGAAWRQNAIAVQFIEVRPSTNARGGAAVVRARFRHYFSICVSSSVKVVHRGVMVLPVIPDCWTLYSGHRRHGTAKASNPTPFSLIGSLQGPDRSRRGQVVGHVFKGAFKVTFASCITHQPELPVGPGSAGAQKCCRRRGCPSYRQGGRRALKAAGQFWTRTPVNAPGNHYDVELAIVRILDANNTGVGIKAA